MNNPLTVDAVLVLITFVMGWQLAELWTGFLFRNSLIRGLLWFAVTNKVLLLSLLVPLLAPFDVFMLAASLCTGFFGTCWIVGKTKRS